MNEKIQSDPDSKSTNCLETTILLPLESKEALRLKAEEAIGINLSRLPEYPEAPSPEAMRQMVHELQVHQIELEMQNVELRRAQVELDAARTRYFDLYDLAPVGYCTVSEKGLILEANLTAATLLGTPRSALVKQPLNRFILKEDRDASYRYCQHLFKTGEPQGYDLRMVKKNGTAFWARIESTTTQEADDKPVGRVVIADITQRKLAEEALKESEQNLRTLSNSGQALVWTSGTDTLCNYFNSVWLAFTGRTLKQELGNGWTEGVHPDDMQHCLDAYRTAFDRREKFSMEYRLRRYDGAYIWLRVDGSPRYNSKGEFIGYIGHCLDVSVRKQVEEKKNKLEEQLHQAQKMEAIGTLAGGIAHDFNNILGVILGYTEIASESLPAGSVAIDYLDKVQEASQRASDLVKQILTFSRQTITEVIVLHPASILKEALKLIRPSLPSTITIKQQIDSATKPILADATQVHQILINLCTNALHAMEETGGTLGITLKDCKLSLSDLQNQQDIRPGRFAMLSVGDSGTGIPLEIQTKIFDPYFTTKEVGKGTGMGLSIVHGIVKRYGGFITCKSNPGEGALFQVFFPTIEQEVTPSTKTIETIQTGKGRVLYIDDEEYLAALGKVMLEHLGYEVTVRTNSLEAWTTFQNQPDQFDLVITDQTMPGLTGSNLAQRMLQVRPNLPIILCTGYTSLVSEEKAKSLGIKGFAMKPLALKELATLLRNVLGDDSISNAGHFS